MNTARKLDTPTVAIVSITPTGRQLAAQIQKIFPQAISYVNNDETTSLADFERLALNQRPTHSLKQAFGEVDLLIAIMATGIVVRSLATLIEDKTKDPAVLVCDEKGQFVISLLSGHVGGANHWTNYLAEQLSAVPVITTATDTQKVCGLDVLAQQIPAYYADFKAQTLTFNSLLARHRPVGLINQTTIELNPAGYELINESETNLDNYEGLVLISDKKDTPIAYDQFDKAKVKLIPKMYALGIGCRKDTSFERIDQLFQEVLATERIDPKSIAKIVSIDLKQNEQGIIALAEQLQIPFETFSKEELMPYESHYPGSEFVRQTVGVASVSQAAAHKETKQLCVTDRYAKDGVTMALSNYQL